MRHILSKPIELELDKQRSLVYNIGSIVDAEDLLGCAITSLPTWKDMQTKQFRLLLWAGLKTDDPSLSVESVGEKASWIDYPKIATAIAQALIQAYGEPDTQASTARNPSGKRRKGSDGSVNWRSWWPLARVSLHMSTAEFWETTPRELLALYDKFLWHLENTDFNFATIAQVIANCNRGKNQKAYKAHDFMPVRRKQRQQTYREQLEIAKQITLAYGGKVRADLLEGAPVNSNGN